MIWTGTVATGSGTCSATPDVLPPRHFHGSLNLVAVDVPLSDRFPRGPRPEGWDGYEWGGNLRLNASVVAVNGEACDPVPVVVGEYAHVELVAEVKLRDHLRLTDGDTITLDVDAVPTSVVVAMPWRATPERLAAHDHCVAWWNRTLPVSPLIEVDTDHHPYNLAAVRNECVRQAEELGADVVVITDADSVLVDTGSLCSAIRGAIDSGGLHLPFTAQRYLTAAETETVLAGGSIDISGHPGNGAMYCVTPDSYWECGGSDERFSGWGGDDDQITAASEALTSLHRHWGTVLSLHHADEHRPNGTPEHRPNSELAQRYYQARHRPDAMRALIAERSLHVEPA